MALFALWRPDRPHADLHRALRDRAHVVAERETMRTIAGWHLSAFATASRFASADAQVWIADDGGEACVLHGVVWRFEGKRAALLDAQALAGLLARPGAALPAALAGEYALVRIHRCGTAEGLGDPAGIGQLFQARAILSNRAGCAALLVGGEAADAESAAWIATIGYRLGTATGWAGVRQLPQGARWTDGRVAPGPRVGPEPGAPRGFDEALLGEGIAQAGAAIALAGEAADGTIALPVTGGKDSRALLAIALNAGLGDRLDLFTRGVPDHPDVVVGCRLAAAAGLPHRREAPVQPGGIEPWTADRFATELARLAFQTDGGAGGWDLVTARRPGRDTQVTGHLGELLRPYAKRDLPPDADTVALVRAQGPFDPLDVLRPVARDRLVAALDTMLATLRAEEDDPAALPDLFYLRHRVPNWLGGVRAVKSFERQPIAPLGVPALTALAFRMTAAERAAELAHFRIVEACAPALLAVPFAHQRWDAALPRAPVVAPVLAPADLPLFGNWQFCVNRDPAIRDWLADLFAAPAAVWDAIDRAAVLARLRETRFDTFGAIALLGLAVSVLHATGRTRQDRIGGDWALEPGARDAA